MLRKLSEFTPAWTTTPESRTDATDHWSPHTGPNYLETMVSIALDFFNSIVSTQLDEDGREMIIILNDNSCVTIKTNDEGTPFLHIGEITGLLDPSSCH